MTNRCSQPASSLQCRAGSFWVAFGGFALVLVGGIIGTVLAFAAVKAQAAANADINARQDTDIREMTSLLRSIHSNQMVIMHHLNIRPPRGNSNFLLPEDTP